MGTRGRPSAADLSVVANTEGEVTHRPGPPEDLTEEQAKVWLTVVNRMPAEWFPEETHPLLAAYCRHAVSARRVAQLIDSCEAAEDFDVAEYDRLLKCQERESRCLASLATKLRISQQTQYDKSKKRGSQTKRPWE